MRSSGLSPIIRWTIAPNTNPGSTRSTSSSYIYIYIYLAIHLSIHISISISIYLSIYMYIYLFKHNHIYLYTRTSGLSPIMRYTMAPSTNPGSTRSSSSSRLARTSTWPQTPSEPACHSRQNRSHSPPTALPREGGRVTLVITYLYLHLYPYLHLKRPQTPHEPRATPSKTGATHLPQPWQGREGCGLTRGGCASDERCISITMSISISI